jgi:hypothetical protein
MNKVVISWVDPLQDAVARTGVIQCVSQSVAVALWQITDVSQATRRAESHWHAKQVDMEAPLLGRRILRGRLPDQWSGGIKPLWRKQMIREA